VLYLCDSFGTLRVYDISDTTNIDPLQDPLVKTHLTGFVKGHGMDDTLNVGDRVPAAGVVLVHHAKVRIGPFTKSRPPCLLIQD
jgi:hypothetical protein